MHKEYVARSRRAPDGCSVLSGCANIFREQFPESVRLRNDLQGAALLVGMVEMQSNRKTLFEN